MTEDFTDEMIEEHRPTYKEGSKTRLSTGEFVAYRVMQVALAIFFSPVLLIALVLALLIGGVPSYTEFKTGAVKAAIGFTTDRSPSQNQCAHEWEFTKGIQDSSEPRGLRADGLHYKVYDSLRYECPHCGKFEWVHANETFRIIEPSDEDIAQ